MQCFVFVTPEEEIKDGMYFHPVKINGNKVVEKSKSFIKFTPLG